MCRARCQGQDREARLLKEMAGGSHSQSLGVFGSLLSCHRDLAACAVSAQLGAVACSKNCETQAANRKTSPGLALSIPQHCRGCPELALST